MSTSGRVQLLMGNEACAEGALAAGVRFFAGYPITPSNEIGEILSRRLPEVGGKFIQMEDEIASMAAIIGASLGGLKAMTATSGPGFSLMQENIGFAAMAEIPCVVVNVMRAGPSTGLPTQPSQGDVMQSRWGTHGDHPVIVLTPSSVKETFDLTVRAVNLSEKYRLPVILLADEVIAHLREKVVLPAPETIERFNRIKPAVPPDWYKPYENVRGGVPPMANFGEGYRYHVTGLTHDVLGFPTTVPEEVTAVIERINYKLTLAYSDIVTTEEFMLQDAEVAIIAYGCVARSAKSAALELRQKGIKTGVLRLITIWPFPTVSIQQLVKRIKKIVVPEMNLGQVYHEVVGAVCGKAKIKSCYRVDGEMLTPGEIIETVLKGFKR